MFSQDPFSCDFRLSNNNNRSIQPFEDYFNTPMQTRNQYKIQQMVYYFNLQYLSQSPSFYIQKSQRQITNFSSMRKSNLFLKSQHNNQPSAFEENSIQTKVNQIQATMADLVQALKDLDSSFNKKKLENLNLNQQQDKHMNTLPISDNKNQDELQLFQEDSNSYPLLQFNEIKDRNCKQLSRMQNYINLMMGQLESFMSISQKDSQEVRIYMMNQEKYKRVYNCKFCDRNFDKACSLGGHISRVHKQVSQEDKIMKKQIQKVSLNRKKQKMLAQQLQKRIGI